MTKSYLVGIADGTQYILKVSPPLPANPSTDHWNPTSLPEVAALSKLVNDQTSVPIPKILVLDTSCTLLKYPYLLLARPHGISLSTARERGKMTERQMLLLELRIGQSLKELHERVQNDWFGLPSQQKDELYSWQEAFTWQLESLLFEAQSLGVDIPFQDVRRYLSKAIGSFLFDDCEVPSLVSLTADEESILVRNESSLKETDEVEITSFTDLSHAIWGDPLLETLFVNPSTALVEGYGGTLVIFERQKTKRLWYTIFLALIVIVQTKRYPDMWLEKDAVAKIEWAKETLNKCILDLKDAPCY